LGSCRFSMADPHRRIAACRACHRRVPRVPSRCRAARGGVPGAGERVAIEIRAVPASARGHPWFARLPTRPRIVSLAAATHGSRGCPRVRGSCRRPHQRYYMINFNILTSQSPRYVNWHLRLLRPSTRPVRARDPRALERAGCRELSRLRGHRRAARAAAKRASTSSTASFDGRRDHARSDQARRRAGDRARAAGPLARPRAVGSRARRGHRFASSQLRRAIRRAVTGSRRQLRRAIRGAVTGSRRASCGRRR
jgi:hypothetical protein